MRLINTDISLFAAIIFIISFTDKITKVEEGTISFYNIKIAPILLLAFTGLILQLAGC